MTDGVDTAIEQLTQGQIECLVLVNQHLTSKEIGPRLGISPHTVDQRIRGALRILGMKRRAHAAQLVASRFTTTAMFQWQPARTEPFVEYQVRPFSTQRREPFPLPFATGHHPRNEMSISLRLLWIVGIASGSAFSVGCYLAGLESLVRLLRVS
ncbi:MAG: helix-turn-helix transcriptional regulator [Sphingomicrobium sp.]